METEAGVTLKNKLKKNNNNNICIVIDICTDSMQGVFREKKEGQSV